ncbi:MAG: ATP-binding cassette domain-containing protein, partial [candidate division Zixibacteria bacterium]
TPPLYPEMEVAEYIDFVGRARGLAGNLLKQRTDYVVNACGLREVFRTTVGTLSRGFGQRVGLAQALIHDPEVLILDEPTSGLDPIQIIGIRDLIKTLAHEKTVIFSTHILQEVEAISDRVVIINEGLIVADGTLEQLRSSVREKQRFSLVVGASSQDLRTALDGLRNKIPFDYNIAEKDGFSKASIESETSEDLWSALTETIRENAWAVKEFSPEKGSLEDAFRHHVLFGSGKKTQGAKAEGGIE